MSVQGEILNLMADLQREHRLAYLIVTHILPVEPTSVPLSETRHVRCHYPLSGG